MGVLEDPAVVQIVSEEDVGEFESCVALVYIIRAMKKGDPCSPPKASLVGGKTTIQQGGAYHER